MACKCVLDLSEVIDYTNDMEQTSTSKLPVCIALAADQLAALDQAAAEQDRSRSYVAGLAIRQYLARTAAQQADAP